MVKEYPLSKELLAMSRVFKSTETQDKIIAAKGAPEAIFDLCHLDKKKIEQFSLAVEKLASDGLRVIGVAKAKINGKGLPEIQHDFSFDFIGLIGLSDPIRENVKQAVSECYTAGIRIIMITGDYPVTAKHIAMEIGLKNPEKCITGQELKEMTDDTTLRKHKGDQCLCQGCPGTET